MKRIINVTLAGFAAVALAVSLGAYAPAFAQMKEKEKSVTVGGAPMYPSKNIVQNAVNSKDHTTLVAAVKAAGLVDTLQSAGPFTVFAPTNEAFAKLPAGTVDTLLKPENKKTLTNVLTYHVVSGRLTAKDLMEKIKAGNGKAMLKTVEGARPHLRREGWQTLDLGRQRRIRSGHHPQRDAVERRHPRDRHRAVAGLIGPLWFGKTARSSPCCPGTRTFVSGVAPRRSAATDYEVFSASEARPINPALTIKWANIAGEGVTAHHDSLL